MRIKTKSLASMDLFDNVGDLDDGESMTSNWERYLGFHSDDHDASGVTSARQFDDPALAQKEKLLRATRRLARTVNTIPNALKEEGESERSMTLRWDDGSNPTEGKNEVVLPVQYVIGENAESNEGLSKDAITGMVLLKQTLKRSMDKRCASEASQHTDAYGGYTAQLWQTVETAVARNQTIDEYPGTIHYFKAHAKFNGAPSKKVLEDSLTYAEPSVQYAIRALEHRLLYPTEKLALPAYYEQAIEEAYEFLSDQSRFKTKRFNACVSAVELIAKHFNQNPPPPPPPMPPPMPQPQAPEDKDNEQENGDEPGEGKLPGNNGSGAENDENKPNDEKGNDDEQKPDEQSSGDDAGNEPNQRDGDDGGGVVPSEQDASPSEADNKAGNQDQDSAGDASGSDDSEPTAGSGTPEAGEAQPGEQSGDTEGDGTDAQGGVSEEVGSDTQSADDSSPDSGDTDNGSDAQDSAEDSSSGQEGGGESVSFDKIGGDSNTAASDGASSSEEQAAQAGDSGMDDGQGGEDGGSSSTSPQSSGGTNGGSNPNPQPVLDVKPASELGQSDGTLFGQPSNAGAGGSGIALPDSVTLAEALRPVCEMPEGMGFPSTPPIEYVVHGGEKAKAVYQEIVNYYRAQINRIVSAFAFRNEDAQYYEHGLRDGELDEEELYQVARPALRRQQPRIWKRKEVLSKPSIAIGLLVDMSGSMGSSVKVPSYFDSSRNSSYETRASQSAMARDVAIVLQNAFSKVAGIEVTVLGFTSDSTVDGGANYVSEKLDGLASRVDTKPFGFVDDPNRLDTFYIYDLLTKDHKDPYGIACIKGIGNTPTSFALEFAARKMAQDYPDHASRFLFQITDGHPSDSFLSGQYGISSSSGTKCYEHTRLVCEFSERYLGVKCYGVGIKNAFTQETGDTMYRKGHCIVINDVLSCVPVITSFLRRIAASMQ